MAGYFDPDESRLSRRCLFQLSFDLWEEIRSFVAQKDKRMKNETMNHIKAN